MCLIIRQYRTRTIVEKSLKTSVYTSNVPIKQPRCDCETSIRHQCHSGNKAPSSDSFDNNIDTVTEQSPKYQSTRCKSKADMTTKRLGVSRDAINRRADKLPRQLVIMPSPTPRLITIACNQLAVSLQLQIHILSPTNNPFPSLIPSAFTCFNVSIKTPSLQLPPPTCTC
jgi:hypothetical protein